MARDLSTSLVIDIRPGGTRVTAVCPLYHRAVVAIERPRLTTVRSAGLTVTRRPGDPPVLAVAGAVDSGSVAELRSAVLRATEGGTRAVVLDLVAVTLLTSAGIRLLHEVAEFTTPPRLVAPVGSPSRWMVELSRLGHLLADTG